MGAKKKTILITKTPPARFIQSCHAHNYLNVKQFTVFNQIAHNEDVYIKRNNTFHKVEQATVKVVDFEALTDK